MKNPKAFFYLVYFLFIGISLVFVFFTEAIFNQMGIQKTLNFLRYWAVFGLALFLIEILNSNLALKRKRKEIARLNNDNASLKAKIYDMDEREKEVDQSLKSFGSTLKSKPEDDPGKDSI